MALIHKLFREYVDNKIGKSRKNGASPMVHGCKLTLFWNGFDTHQDETFSPCIHIMGHRQLRVFKSMKTFLRGR